MRSFVLMVSMAMWSFVQAQDYKLFIQPVFSNEKIMLEKHVSSPNGDSIVISGLKFYLGHFEFWKSGGLIFSEKKYHLIDLEDENSLQLVFDCSIPTAFDSLRFYFGTDSLTNTAGAMGGDLDPTRGMFWTWQSGYINLKLEGFSSRCPNRAGKFEFHLGGYLSPFQTVRSVVLSNPESEKATLNLDLASFFQQIDWQKKSNVMSPGTEAVRLTDVLAHSFSWDEK